MSETNLMKPQQFEIPVDIYRRNVLVCINESSEEIDRILTESEFDRVEIDRCLSAEPGYGAAMCYVFPDRNCLIWINGDAGPVFHDCVAHEIAHAAFAILDYMGIKLGSKSEEAYAYLIGYITREFYEKLES